MQRKFPVLPLPWLALITVYIFWGSTYLGIRYAVKTFPPYLMGGSRYIIAGLLLGAIIWIFSKEKPQLPDWKQLQRSALSALFLLGGGNGLLAVGELRLDSGVASLFVATTPIWMLLFNAILSRRMIPWPSIVGLFLGTLGIVALVGVPSSGVGTGPAMLVIFGSICWAIGSLIAAKDTSENESNQLRAATEMLCGGIIMSIIGICTGELANFHLAQITTPSIYGWLWLIGPGAMIGYTAYAYAVRTLSTDIVATYAYVNPTIAILIGITIAREPLTWNILTGGTCIILSVIAILFGNTLQTTRGRVVRRGLRGP